MVEKYDFSNMFLNAEIKIPKLQDELKSCPFCQKQAVFIGVHDDEGNYHGRIGCDYKNDAWSGLCYALHHEGWGECLLCTDGEEQTMGGVLFDTIDEAVEGWNGTPKERGGRVEST